MGGPGAVVLSLSGRVLKPSCCLMTCCFPPIPLDGWVISKSISCVLPSAFNPHDKGNQLFEFVKTFENDCNGCCNESSYHYTGLDFFGWNYKLVYSFRWPPYVLCLALIIIMKLGLFEWNYMFVILFGHFLMCTVPTPKFWRCILFTTLRQLWGYFPLILLIPHLKSWFMFNESLFWN